MQHRTNALSERKERITIAIVLAVVSALLGVDIALDAMSWDVKSTHVVVEIVSAAVLVALSIWLSLLAIRMRRATETFRDRAAAAEQAAREWEDATRDTLKWLGNEISLQMDRWELTPAEKEVGMQLLRGRSFKQIAARRNVSERTVRLQASTVYHKAGLHDRAELAAFFLAGLPDE